jgi:hypothetical protein
VIDLERRRMFPDVPTIGELTGDELQRALEELGDVSPSTGSGSQASKELGEASPSTEPDSQRRGIFGSGTVQPWQHATHQFGYVAPSTDRFSPQGIVPVGRIEPDESLVNQRINIHLNYLRVAKYPGSGQHRILFTFKAKNQLDQMPEPISFSQLFRARDNEAIAVVGQPIFIGLNVGQIGAAFQGFTVNVQNDNDEALLGFLDSPAFKSGLTLLRTAQPALTPLMDMTLGVTKALAGRNKNVAVQDFYLGLGFSSSTMGARLACGDYLAAQVPTPTSINWTEWHYDPNVGTIVNIKDSRFGLPYNYVVFGISRHPASKPE